jgi:hypothetical protein
MNKNTMLEKAFEIIRAVPESIQYMTREYKTIEFFLARIEGLVSGVYSNRVGGDFVDIMASLIRGQVEDAYNTAWQDEGYFLPLPAYLSGSMDTFITTQTNFDWIYQYYKDIVDARIDGTPLQPLLSRANMWANQYNAAYNEAMRLIMVQTGGNMIWQEGDTKDKCSVCVGLDGLIMSAQEWELIGMKPQSDRLPCGGFNCHCDLVPTSNRRSPNAYGRAEEIILAGHR